MLKKEFDKHNIEVDLKLQEKYKDKNLFEEKHEWAIKHVNGRNIRKEINEFLEKDLVTKS